MAIALPEEQKQFIDQMIRSGRFHTESEVVGEALRRMASGESSYLTPVPLTPAQVEEIYSSEGDAAESAFGKAAFAAVQRAARDGKRP